MDTYKMISPEIMKVKHSSKREEIIDWDYEIKKNKELLNVFYTKSRLDNIISENQIINGLNDLSLSDNNSGYTKYLYTMHKTINKMFPNYYRILLNDNVTRKISKRLKHKHIDCFYLKYIILKGVLIQSGSTVS